jgi:hypothetical protein
VLRSGSENVLVDNEVSAGTLFDPNHPSGPQGDGIFVGDLTAGTILRRNFATLTRATVSRSRAPTPG